MLVFRVVFLSLLTNVGAAAAAAAKSLQSCLTLCDPTDSSPPGSAIPGILQARTLEWVAISFSNVWKWKVKVKSLSHVRLFATPWTAAHQAPCPRDFLGKSTGVRCHCLLRVDTCYTVINNQAPLPKGFSRQEHWSGVPLPSPVDKCYTVINTTASLVAQMVW